jgi:hypothetical protein
LGLQQWVLPLLPFSTINTLEFHPVVTKVVIQMHNLTSLLHSTNLGSQQFRLGDNELIAMARKNISSQDLQKGDKGGKGLGVSYIHIQSMCYL